MAKFSNASIVNRPPTGPLSAGPAVITTYEGGTGYAEDAKTELFTLAVTNMVGEKTFYDTPESRDARFEALVHQVATADPAWMTAFIPWLRNSANMRSASVVAAVEFSMALRGQDGSRARRIAVIDGACQRADEPAEVLGYVMSKYGRALPAVVKAAVAQAATRLYNEYSAIKYDGQNRAIRMGDVIELTHPRAKDASQSALFKHLLDRRHDHFDGNLAALRDGGLTKLAGTYAVDAIPEAERHPLLVERGPSVFDGTVYTWERVSGWVGAGKMDATAWASIIPQMGYMALLRNLRNFEEAGVDKAVLKQVAATLTDPEQVVRSRQFPYRFWSAFKNSGTMFFGPALEEAMEGSVVNIPKFSGRTLVLIDTSGSMDFTTVSDRSKVKLHEIGSLFGAAVAAQSNVDLVLYASDSYQIKPSTSVLRTIQGVQGEINKVGSGTETWPSVRKHFDGHDRVIIFTDMQDHPDRVRNYSYGRGPSIDNSYLKNVPVYVWDLAGHGRANIDTSNPGHYLLGGFSDQAFRLIGLLEAGRNADWAKLFAGQA